MTTTKARRRATGSLIPVERREDIPAFASEEEEHRFWSTHQLAGELLDSMEPVPEEGDDWLPPARPRSTPVLIRFNEDVITRARALAAKRHMGYQTLIKQFVAERLYEEEKRTGLR
jgi:hypothetical protein